jgi:hypothetical protein
VLDRQPEPEIVGIANVPMISASRRTRRFWHMASALGASAELSRRREHLHAAGVVLSRKRCEGKI